ncbi:MAG TPA: nucleoside recognition domain-containing protein, partial [bacterium]|nr:nucleoside recognition domain-containing protein [bacterium]
RQRAAEGILGRVVTQVRDKPRTFAQVLGTLAMRPLTGVPMALAILWACYQFVGVFGAGTLVGLLEENFFGGVVNPWLVTTGSQLLGLGAVELGNDAAMSGGLGRQIAAALFNLMLGENGIVTLGITYAVAIILPIVFTFFLFFSVLEDTGYFPRLALLVDCIFKFMGLNGRAVIPIVLGFGCDTMATMVTRIQESQRERLITTFLLALAIPCSAQIGVILALLGAAGIQAGVPGGVYWLWVAFMATAFVVIGFLASKVIPGDAAGFYMEVPPLRWPVLKNILVKTFSRMQWYTLEIIPLFVWASVIIWALDLTGILHWLLVGIKPLATFIGLPGGEDGLGGAKVVLQGFFRRDYGAAGLYDFA